MRKTKLDLGALAVESFATMGGAGDTLGTVRGHDSEIGTCMTVCVGLCGGGGQSGVPTCNCPTEAGCAYPTRSCGPTETYGENTCFCLYERTHYRVCCDGEAVSGGGMC